MFLIVLTFLFFYATRNGLWLIIKGFIFAQLLILAGFSDAATGEIPDEVSASVLLDGIILFRPDQALEGFFIISLPLFLLGKLIRNSVGGGDIKLMAACGFVLGPSGAIAGFVISVSILLIARLISLPFHRRRQKATAMAPYFAIGYIAAFVLQFKR
jgi:leader peptidase (prepilin peptidase) / N-methyltransferase